MEERWGGDQREEKNKREEGRRKEGWKEKGNKGGRKEWRVGVDGGGTEGREGNLNGIY